MGLGTLALRSTVGGIILAHGLQKLNGSFGGPGLEGTEKSMESLGLHPPKYQAWAVAISETVGGGLTAAGFLSPLGPAMIIGSQAVAVQKVHRKNGFWLHNRGYEYNLALIAGAFALAESGPGSLSLDALFGKRRRGLGWALTSVALALGAAAVTLKVADRMAPKELPASEDGAQVSGAPVSSAAQVSGAPVSSSTVTGVGGETTSSSEVNPEPDGTPAQEQA
jgi:putative oxidoreductase